MARAISDALTVERVDNAVLITLNETGAFVMFDNLPFAVSVAHSILRVSMFASPQRILVDGHGCVRALPDEGAELLTGPIAAEDFDGTEGGTGEPPC